MLRSVSQNKSLRKFGGLMESPPVALVLNSPFHILVVIKAADMINTGRWPSLQHTQLLEAPRSRGADSYANFIFSSLGNPHNFHRDFISKYPQCSLLSVCLFVCCFFLSAFPLRKMCQFTILVLHCVCHVSCFSSSIALDLPGVENLQFT